MQHPNVGRGRLGWTLLLLSLTLGTLAGSAIGGADDADENEFIHAENIVYANSEVGFMLSGPKGWAGLIQHYDPLKGRLAYDYPPEIRALYKKEYSQGGPPVPFIPLLEVQIFSNTARKSSMELLGEYVDGASSDAFITRPMEAAFGGKRWAVCERKMFAAFEGAQVPVQRKTYLLAHKDSVIVILGTSSVQEYYQDRALFDEVVAKITFSDNLIKQVLPDAAGRSEAFPIKPPR